MILLPNMPDADWLHSRQASGILRASANLVGEYAGAAFASGDQRSSLLAAKADVCTTPGCELLDVFNYVNKLSHIRPAEFVYFALLELEPGGRRSWQAVVEELSGDDGIEYAAAHTFGHPTIQGVVEVVGDDHDAVLSRVLELTDLPMVRSCRVLSAGGEDTRGFGDAPAS